jgi:uncharacterized protein
MLDAASKGRLMSSYCIKCNRYVWPPNYYCNRCNSDTIFKDLVERGILVEKSTSYIHGKIEHFGIGEFDGIRIIGTITDQITVGDTIGIKSIKVTKGRLDISFVGIPI